MENNSITKTYYVNGPVNIMRLTKDNKIIYIFGDVHNNKQSQIPCPPNIDSIDIDDLLLKIFEKNKDVNFNLFCETYISNNNLKSDKKFYIDNINNLIYIEKIFKIVIDNVNYDDKNSLIPSKKYKNVKFHWFDIRKVQEKSIRYYNSIFNNIVNHYTFPYSRPIMLHIIAIIKIFMLDYNKIILNLNSNKYIKKLLGNYKNNNLKKIINDLYNKYVINTLNKINLLCNEILLYYNDNKKKFNNNLISYEEKIDLCKKIHINLININELYGVFYCSIADLFILRRILDKDYIDNSIIYCGSFHMFEIAYYLIKYFNFKVTNVSYSANIKESDNIGKINHILNNIKYDDANSIEFLNNYLVNDFTEQCSNLFTFPDDLL